MMTPEQVVVQMLAVVVAQLVVVTEVMGIQAALETEITEPLMAGVAGAQQLQALHIQAVVGQTAELQLPTPIPQTLCLM
jgi:hypothetical protein